jgi:hypothetical protein
MGKFRSPLDRSRVLSHSNPRPLGPLNPGDESNFFGDELIISYGLSKDKMIDLVIDAVR